MTDDPFENFTELIVDRAFDNYQHGLRARWAGHQISYELTYGEVTSKPSLSLDYEVSDAVGRVTLWVSGECDLEVISGSGEDILRETCQFQTSREFHLYHPKVPLTLMKYRGDDMSRCSMELPDI